MASRHDSYFRKQVREWAVCEFPSTRGRIEQDAQADKDATHVRARSVSGVLGVTINLRVEKSG